MLARLPRHPRGVRADRRHAARPPAPGRAVTEPRAGLGAAGPVARWEAWARASLHRVQAPGPQTSAPQNKGDGAARAGSTDRPRTPRGRREAMRRLENADQRVYAQSSERQICSSDSLAARCRCSGGVAVRRPVADERHRRPAAWCASTRFRLHVPHTGDGVAVGELDPGAVRAECCCGRDHGQLADAQRGEGRLDEELEPVRDDFDRIRPPARARRTGGVRVVRLRGGLRAQCVGVGGDDPTSHAISRRSPCVRRRSRDVRLPVGVTNSAIELVGDVGAGDGPVVVDEDRERRLAPGAARRARAAGRRPRRIGERRAHRGERFTWPRIAARGCPTGGSTAGASARRPAR